MKKKDLIDELKAASIKARCQTRVKQCVCGILGLSDMIKKNVDQLKDTKNIIITENKLMLNGMEFIFIFLDKKQAKELKINDIKIYYKIKDE